MQRIVFFALFLSISTIPLFANQKAVEQAEENIKSDIVDLKYEVLNTNDDGSVVLKLIPENFPKDKQISLLIERLDHSRDAVRNLFLNDRNEIVHKDNPDRPYLLFLNNLVKGEPVIIGLVEPATSQRAVAKIVPFPIEVQDEKGRHLTLELNSVDGMSFHFRGVGFRPKEKLIMRSTTGKKIVTTTAFATATGTFAGNLRPESIGKKSGTSTFEISNKYTSLKVNFAWGQAAFSKG